MSLRRVPTATADNRVGRDGLIVEPEALRPPADYVLMGYTFEDYDKASR